MNIARIERVSKSGPQILYDAESPIVQDGTYDSKPSSGTSRATGAVSPDEDGAALIHDLEDFLTRFVILPAYTVLPLALWALMTHTFDSFDAVPYLVISSPAPRCGKTRLLECLELVVSTPRRAS